MADKPPRCLTMRIGAIIAGLVFLFGPNVNLIDIMPDAIGFGLILYGILPISRAEGHMADGARHFRNLFVLELVKLGTLFFYGSFTGGEKLMILLITMVFSVCEIFFGIKAWMGLFDGVEALGDPSRHPAVFDKLKMIRTFTLIFTVLKSVFAFLPDLTLLDDNRYGVVTDTGIQSWQQFRGALSVLSAALVLIVGVVWLVLTVSYFRKVKKEKDFLEKIKDCVANYFARTESLVFRNYIFALTFLMYACIFCLELKVEGYSLLPPMISGVLFLIFFILTRKSFGRVSLVGLISSASYLVISAVGWVFLYLFADRYYFEEVGGGFSESIFMDIDGMFAVFDQYLGINIVVAISQIAFVVMLVSLVKAMKSLADTHTGAVESLVPEREKTDVMRQHEASADRAAKASVKRPLPFLLITGVLTAVSSAIFPMLQVYVPSFFMIDLAIRVLFVAVAVTCVGKLRQGVRIKGGLDYE